MTRKVKRQGLGARLALLDELDPPVGRFASERRVAVGDGFEPSKA